MEPSEEGGSLLEEGGRVEQFPSHIKEWLSSYDVDQGDGVNKEEFFERRFFKNAQTIREGCLQTPVDPPTRVLLLAEAFPVW